MANSPQRHEVVVQVPEMGLDDKQLHALKETFQNHFVSTMKGKSAAETVVVVVVIRVQRVATEI